MDMDIPQKVQQQPPQVDSADRTSSFRVSQVTSDQSSVSRFTSCLVLAAIATLFDTLTALPSRCGCTKDVFSFLVVVVIFLEMVVRSGFFDALHDSVTVINIVW
jgi:hypothetical protein